MGNVVAKLQIIWESAKKSREKIVGNWKNTLYGN